MAPMHALWLSLCVGSAAIRQISPDYPEPLGNPQFKLNGGAPCRAAKRVEGIACKQVPASGFIFDCRFAGEANRSSGDVMLLHGFPEWASMYDPVMLALAAKGYRSVACDQRGYSPGAAPEREEDYNYDKLRDDVFAVADAVGFSKFHVVSHDHGALLGWYAAGSPRGQERFLSFSALSIPHNDAFSAGLLGPSADVDQQLASQYFSIFSMPGSASMKAYSLFLTMGLASGFKSASGFQKALWWYNGAFEVGVLSRPPSYTASHLFKNGYKAMAAFRALYGGNPDEGIPQKVKSGPATMPTLFACGTANVTIMCDRPYARATEAQCTNDYQHLAVDCGHDLLACGSKASTQAVIDAIVRRIVSATPARSIATPAITGGRTVRGGRTVQ